MENQKRLTTDRGLFLYIVFTIITLGIYPLVAFSLVSKEVNKVCDDEKHTMQYWIVFFLSPLALGIPLLVWYHRISNRIGYELKRREINYSFSASTFWGWFILGSLLFGIGPLVFIHKFFKASNKINADYNAKRVFENKEPEAPYSVASLTLGIISIIISAIGFIGVASGIIGLVLANNGLAQYNQNPSAYSNANKIKIGRITSIIGILLSGIVSVYSICIAFI